MGILNIIYWEDAFQHFKHNHKEDVDEVKRLIAEIETSDFSLLDARDVQYYANELNKYSNRKHQKGELKGKPHPYTPNEIRRINMEAKGISSYELIDSFIDDDTDDIIDFY